MGICQFNAVRYNIVIELNMEKNLYYATQKVVCDSAKVNHVNEIVIRKGFTNIEPNSITVDTDCEIEMRGDCFIVRLNHPFNIGDDLSLDFKYHAVLPKSTYWKDAFYEFAGEESWYPRLSSEPASGCNYDVTVLAPDSVKIYGTGYRQGISFTGKGIQNFGFIATEGFPICADRMQNMQLACLYPKGYELLAKNVIETAKEAVEYYRTLLGFYPVDSFTFVPGPEYWGGGCPIATGMVYLHGMQRAKGSFEFDNWIVAHELAHQYFGDKVDFGCISWVWLGLGLSLDYEFMMHTNRNMGQYEDFEKRLFMAIQAEKAVIPESGDELRKRLADEDFDYNTDVMHAKALAIILALQKTVGKKAYFRIIERYHSKYGCTAIPERAFIRLCEEESGMALQNKFEEWLRHNTYPSAAE